MNLVAKEYIAAQNPDNPGVLLLSRYAGAAEQMQAAVIIDPLQPESIIHGLNTALTMPLAERKSRYQTLFQGLEQRNLHTWQQDFLKDLYHCSHKT
jgi:trehalose 6-phosphate synthase